MSVKYSMPDWIISMWKEYMSYDEIEDILIGMKKDKKTYIRCNTLKGNTEYIKQRLNDEGVKVTAIKGIPYAYEISGYDHLTALKSFNEGLYQIQDISSMVAGEYVLPCKDSIIVDVCAAPGGKSVNAALKMAESAYNNIDKIPLSGISGDNINGMVISRDVSDYKASLIEENVERLGIKNIKIQVYDALKKDAALEQKADIVIADLPCSGLGIMGRKPDIRYNISHDKIKDIIRLQRDILKVISSYVKPGGALIYSTCTINKAENEDNADWICNNLGFVKDGEYNQLLPSSESDNDGFFVARLIKN